jgi:hypothetical protein
MEASKLPKLDGETSTLALRWNPPSVYVEDENAISRTYFRYPVPAALLTKKL